MLNQILTLIVETERLKKELESLPKGSLQIIHAENGIRYRRNIKGQRTYLQKKRDGNIIELLMNKREVAAVYDSNMRILSSMLKKNRGAILQMLNQIETVKLKRFPVSVSEENFYTEELKHKTNHGEMVRSKSEVIIANILYESGIEYAYEKKLTTPTGTIYPDFTVKHPYTGVIYYLEHLGMKEKNEYAKKWEQKLDKYKSADISVGGRLITTTEKNGIIDAEEIKKIIELEFTIKKFEKIKEILNPKDIKS